ncbi:hypothetical protein Belba_2519 [Belliella baltica DSM 15883]|uniref:Class I SAM-dependent methyltransferase n=1 Tax=Belliella baltica (strain DSM 15883 / CIP 108006 / LMG 21964 / BA134) TaxID=866536 RepID=I3Z754_BELBD|nr:class I SAM-dependent methyltransferase [Belliella baltica]AFL85072.1 hypothetical protein Belba_2519 [Belliella baltica DSM 15883]
MNNKNNHELFEFLKYHKRITGPDSWVDHIPFVKYLINIKKSNLIVELGTHTGNSFCGILEAIKEFQPSSKAYAIDTWEGDDHAGFYEDSVFTNLNKYIEDNYSQNGFLIRKRFDEALNMFSDNSIDILHIDGLHTYEAVKNDFVTWRSKVKSDGVILFHDTCVLKDGFGVHIFWEEIKDDFINYNFLFGNGLGVISLDLNNTSEVNILLRNLNENIMYQGFFSELANNRQLKNLLKKSNYKLENVRKSRFIKIWNFLRKSFGIKTIEL